MDKDQKAFLAHCQNKLQNYNGHMKKAKELYRIAFDNEPIQHKKDNAGIISANKYMLSQLRLIFEYEWRPQKKQNNKITYTATGAAVNSGVKPMKPIPKGMKGIVL